jgi:hypothetical protein
MDGDRDIKESVRNDILLERSVGFLLLPFFYATMCFFFSMPVPRESGTEYIPSTSPPPFLHIHNFITGYSYFEITLIS